MERGRRRGLAVSRRTTYWPARSGRGALEGACRPTMAYLLLEGERFPTEMSHQRYTYRLEMVRDGCPRTAVFTSPLLPFVIFAVFTPLPSSTPPLDLPGTARECHPWPPLTAKPSMAFLIPIENAVLGPVGPTPPRFHPTRGRCADAPPRPIQNFTIKK